MEFKNKSSRNQRKKDKDNARTQEIKDLFKDNKVQDIKNVSANQIISKGVDILEGLFTNPEFQQRYDNSMEVSEQKPDNVTNCTIL